jgi:hypothetical protein
MKAADSRELAPDAVISTALEIIGEGRGDEGYATGLR